MKEYLLSVSAAVVLTAIISILLPEGKTAKVIKGTFSMITLLIFIKPALSLKDGLDFSEIFTTYNGVEVQESFLIKNTELKSDFYSSVCEKAIENIGYKGIKIIVNCEYADNYVFAIKNVEIFLSDSSYNGEKVHIDNTEEIVDSVCEVISIKKNQTEFKIYE